MRNAPSLHARLMHHLVELPVLPAVVSQLMALSPADRDYADKVVTLIGAEPNFAIRVIGAANSAASAPASPITTLGAAIARIGSFNASNLIMNLGVTRVFVPRDDWERGLWRHSIHVAVMSRALVAHARPPGINPEEAYLAGLLHDVGRFVMFQEAPDQLRRVDESNWDSPEELVRYERAICGLDHAQIGGLACRKWSIPAVIADSIENHHRPRSVPVSIAERLTAIVHVADLAMFSSVMPSTQGEASAGALANELRLQLPRDVQMNAEDLERLIVGATAEAETMFGLTGLG